MIRGGRIYPFLQLLNYKQKLAPSLGRLISLSTQFHMQNLGTPLLAGVVRIYPFLQLLNYKEKLAPFLARLTVFAS